jgi:hypothetical protein
MKQYKRSAIINKNISRYENFLSDIIKLLQTYILGLGIFFIFRIVYLVRFSPKGLIHNYLSDLPVAFIRGIQFDTVILCYLLILPLLLAISFSFFRSQKIQRFYYSFCKYFFFVVLLLAILILFIDQQYYTYFQSHINVLIFGFFKDDTLAVLKSIWTDHPVILIVILYLILGIITFRLLRMIWLKPVQSNFSHNFIIKILFPILFFVLYFYGMRGSLAILPLSEEDASVSGNQFINLIPVNGVFAVKTAIKEHSVAQADLSPVEVLEKYNKHSVNELISDYYDIPTDSVIGNYVDYLFKTTPKNEFLEINKPDVVFVLMESFGGYFLNFHSQTLNLLGKLEEHIQTDYFFKNFISSTRGTIYSLESILINSTGWPLISDTPKRFVQQPSSIAFPFKNAGYETIFITAGKINWRNNNELLPNLYFDRLIGNTLIRKDFPEAVDYTWGVSDDFLYKEIMKLLNEKSSTPKLIFALTTCNHTPFKIPPDYKGFPINIPDSLYKMIIANKDIAQLVFKSYQYSCNSLGEFMTTLKASSHAGTTIVGATSDHNSYALFPFESDLNQPADKHLVPFYLYLPELYKQNKNATSNRAGSHKDIFPTIICNALSNQRYFCAGNNLLEPENNNIYFGDNLDFIYALSGTPPEIVEKKSTARRQLLEYYLSDYYQKKPGYSDSK